MIISCKWLPPWGNSWGNLMMSYTHACMGHPHIPTATPTHIHPPHPPQRGPPNQLTCNKTCMNWDISILFEDLKSVEISPPMNGCIIWWMGELIGEVMSNHKNLINLDIIGIIQFCLKIYDLWRHSQLWVGWWVGSCEITKILINLDLIEIIQFCLNIYDLLRYPHLWVGGWVDGWVNV